MAHFSFAAMLLRGRPTLTVPILLALLAPAAFGQGRGMHPRPFMTPFMRRTTTPAMTTTPISRMNVTTNALLRRDVRLDSLLLRDLRLERFRRAEFGPFGTPFGANPFWGTWGGGFAGSGLLEIPVGVPSGTATTPTTATTTAQKAPEDTEASARATLLLEQALAARLENRRKAFDELQYERDRTPTPEKELLNRSRVNPSQSEILSAQALNALLDDLRANASGTDAADQLDLPLPSGDWLRHINISRGGGSLALLKDGGRLTWPAALADPVFQEPRERLTEQATAAVGQLRARRRIDPVDLRQMAANVSQLRWLLRENAKGLSFQSFIEARDFLQQFNDAVVVLGRPDAADYLDGAHDLHAQTVLGLAKQMTDEGLRFAPAGPGDEAAYAALWEALAACDRAAVRPLAAAH
jgi:hypothetical protein